MKTNNKRELQNIAINHSERFTKKHFNFLTIDTTLPVSDLLRFRKNLFDSHKNDIN